jgi:hypothetical protein
MIAFFVRWAFDEMSRGRQNLLNSALMFSSRPVDVMNRRQTVHIVISRFT